VVEAARAFAVAVSCDVASSAAASDSVVVVIDVGSVCGAYSSANRFLSDVSTASTISGNVTLSDLIFRHASYTEQIHQ
jgi:hypothetical protein